LQEFLFTVAIILKKILFRSHSEWNQILVCYRFQPEIPFLTNLIISGQLITRLMTKASSFLLPGLCSCTTQHLSIQEELPERRRVQLTALPAALLGHPVWEITHASHRNSVRL